MATHRVGGTARGLRQGGLRARLLRSHLAIAGLCAVLFILTVAAIAWLRSEVGIVAERHAPTARNAAALRGGLHQSMSALRGFVALSDPELRDERRLAWELEIRPALAGLRESDVHALAELHHDLDRLAVSQWWVEDMASAVGQDPVRRHVDLQVTPIRQSLERSLGGLSVLAGAEGPTGYQLALVRTALTTADLAMERVVSGQGERANRVMSSALEEATRAFDRAARALAEQAMLAGSATAADCAHLVAFTRTELDAYVGRARRVPQLRAKHPVRLAESLMDRETKPMARRISGALESLDDAARGRMDGQVRAASRLASTVSWLGALLGLVALASSVVLAHRSAQRVAAPVARLAHATAALAKRDRASRLPVEGDDEIAQLTEAFNETSAALEDRRRLVVAQKDELRDQNVALAAEVSERNRAQAELVAVQRELIDTARQAGIAEVATDVVHTIGNVLNSAKTSAEVLRTAVGRSKIGGVGKLATMLDQPAERLDGFLTRDPKGRLIPQYLTRLGDELSDEAKQLRGELDALLGHLQGIERIVTSHAELTGKALVLEDLAIDEIAAEVIGTADLPPAIRLVPRLSETPVIPLERHRVSEILWTLLANAVEAVADTQDPEIGLSTSADADAIRVCVSDNGVGIAAADIEAIFEHGYTTKPGKAGFGLHAAANAATPLGGTLEATSEGEGQGACFVLSFPVRGSARAA